MRAFFLHSSMQDEKESTSAEDSIDEELEATVATKDVELAMASRGSTILWLVFGIMAYIGIQWVMPKVGLNSWLFPSGAPVGAETGSTWGPAGCPPVGETSKKITPDSEKPEAIEIN